MKRHSVIYEMKQVRNIFDTSLKAHLEAKGALCQCCEQIHSLCRCIKRVQGVRIDFMPSTERANVS